MVDVRVQEVRTGQARRRDSNENAIVKALQKLGVVVKRISAEGLPDLLCYHSFTGLFLLEVKAGKGTLTEAQQRTVDEIPFRVTRSVDEAVDGFLAEVRKYK